MSLLGTAGLFHRFLFENQDEEEIDRVLNEPKRQKVPIETMNLKPNEGYHNILATLKKASKEEIDYWGNWYYNAHKNVRALASEYQVPLEVAGAVCAVLSPNLSWPLNVMAARRVLDNWMVMNGSESHRTWDKIPAYKTNVRKAMQILDTGDVGVVRGPKVTVFYQSLVDPSTLRRDLVLDGHAINVWRGGKVPLKNLKGPTKQERQWMIDDYRKVADITGLTPQAVQAITWFVWKSVKDTPPEPAGVFPVVSAPEQHPQAGVTPSPEKKKSRTRRRQPEAELQQASP
jgi:hypothetical protein